MKTYQCQVGLTKFLFSLVYVTLFDAIIPILKYNAIFSDCFLLESPLGFFSYIIRRALQIRQIPIFSSQCTFGRLLTAIFENDFTVLNFLVMYSREYINGCG